MFVRVPFLIAGIAAAAILVGSIGTSAVARWGEPTPTDQCLKYGGSLTETIELALRRIR